MQFKDKFFACLSLGERTYRTETSDKCVVLAFLSLPLLLDTCPMSIPFHSSARIFLSHSHVCVLCCVPRIVVNFNFHAGLLKTTTTSYHPLHIVNWLCLYFFFKFWILKCIYYHRSETLLSILVPVLDSNMWTFFFSCSTHRPVWDSVSEPHILSVNLLKCQFKIAFLI